MLQLLRTYLAQGSIDWAIRRRLVILIVLFCMGIIIWSIGWIVSDSRSENATNQAFTILATIITVYIGGVVADDYLKKKAEKETKTESKPEQPKTTDKIQITGD